MATKLSLARAGDGGSQMIDGVRMPTEIVLRNVVELLPYARNTKTHSAAQVAALARNMQRIGFTNPVLIADDGILAGHGRVLAAHSLKLTKVPTIDLSHLSEDERRALVIWDNRSAEIGSGYDLEMLKLETDELRDKGLDIELMTGFDEGDLAQMLAGLVDEQPAGGGDPDGAPPAPDNPVSQLGDVWVCGDHRVMCGSALEPADWAVLMAGEQADLVWTDPPFNVNQGRKNREQDKWDGGSRSQTGSIENDAMSSGDFYDFLLGAFQALFGIMKAGAPIYVAHADLEGANFRNAFIEAGLKLQSCIIWAKNVMVLGRMDFQSKHEPILYGWKPGAKHKWYGGRKNTSVLDLGDGSPFLRMDDGRWQIRVGDSVLIVAGDAMVEEHPASVINEPKPSKSGLHPTQKPVNLVARLLRQSARRGDVVVDSFGGSGTTLVAADSLGMRARLMELDPSFVDVIVTRWMSLTGGRAAHALTGEMFPGGAEPAPFAAPAAPASLALPGLDVF